MKHPPDPKSMDDQGLLQRIQKGDLRASRHFYERYAPIVYRYVRLCAASDEDAQDITADVFIEVWQALHQHPWREQSITAWILRIAYNHLARTYGRGWRFSFTRWLPWNTSGREPAHNPVDRQDELRRALGGLSYEQQMLVYLAFFEGYTDQEIARLLNKPESTVNVAKMQALKQMGKALKEHR